MTRSVSSPTLTKASQPITQPGYFVQFTFPITGILRFSSRGDLTWNTFPWIGNNVQVGNLQESPNGGANISLRIGNADKSFGAICLLENTQEKPVSIWAFYEGALSTNDPVLIFEGVIDSCGIEADYVSITLSMVNSKNLFIPRRRITLASGFSRLSPVGRVISFSGVNYTLTKG